MVNLLFITIVILFSNSLLKQKEDMITSRIYLPYVYIA